MDGAPLIYLTFYKVSSLGTYEKDKRDRSHFIDIRLMDMLLAEHSYKSFCAQVMCVQVRERQTYQHEADVRTFFSNQNRSLPLFCFLVYKN